MDPLDLLGTLVNDAETIVEGDLPTIAQVRGVVGALIKRLEVIAPQLLTDAARPPVVVPEAIQVPTPGTPVVVPPQPAPVAAPVATQAAPLVADAPAPAPLAPAPSVSELDAAIAQLEAQRAAALANQQAPTVAAG